MGKTLFISDLHFNHEDIISFDRRPFKDKKHMFYAMVDKWNRKVTNDDIVYVLGDFSIDKKPETILSILKRLNGTKYLIVGNHDQCLDDERVKEAWSNHIASIEEVVVDGKKVILSHYPLASWKNMQGFGPDHKYAPVHLYGHVHMTKEFNWYKNYLENIRAEFGYEMKAFNVGAMLPYMNYVPRTLDEIISCNDIL